MVHLIINTAINVTTRQYLDPGSGSMLIQFVLGAVLGLGVIVRVFWKNIKDFFTRGKGNTEELLDPTVVPEDPTQVISEVEDAPKDKIL